MNKRIITISLALSLILGLFFASEKIEAKRHKKANVVCPGIEVLRTRNFDVLQGKKVGLVTNPSGVDRNLRSTIDILFNAKGFDLVALYGPEHGVRGDVLAGAHIKNISDPKTGLPVYSIYGDHREPTPEMLKGVDVMVYDIQDIGSRSYTFISTLGLVMRACAKQGIEVVVLDRPNPLGGNKIEGSYVEPGFYSFVSEFKIPYIYGLTVGELALLINEEGLNRGQKGDEEHLRCDLTVVPMTGWTRDMLYMDTKLPWVLPSPNIPAIQSAIAYPSSGICGEFNNYLNIGIGYTLPFETFAAEWIDADKLKNLLDSYEIPGVAFRTIHYTPLFGSKKGLRMNGVQYFYTDYNKATLTLTQFYVMQAVNELYPRRNPFLSNAKRMSMFEKVCGSDYIRKEFSKRLMVEDIERFWNKDVKAFRKLSQKYHLYD